MRKIVFVRKLLNVTVRWTKEYLRELRPEGRVSTFDISWLQWVSIEIIVKVLGSKEIFYQVIVRQILRVSKKSRISRKVSRLFKMLLQHRNEHFKIPFQVNIIFCIQNYVSSEVPPSSNFLGPTFQELENRYKIEESLEQTHILNSFV